MVAVNIQDTLRSAASDGKHGPIPVMKRAVNTSAAIMMIFYLLVGCAGYAAFGNSISGNILEQFDGPQWVLDMANAMVLLHLIPAFQVYSQPFLCFMEAQIKGSAKAPSWAKVRQCCSTLSAMRAVCGRCSKSKANMSSAFAGCRLPHRVQGVLLSVRHSARMHHAVLQLHRGPRGRNRGGGGGQQPVVFVRQGLIISLAVSD